MTRRLYIDWLRGVAVLLMILWHVVDAWTLRHGRDTVPFATIAFLAGWAAPLFLFLAGLAMPLAAAAKVHRGADRGSAARALRRRGWEVFGLAHLFRFQSFLLNPNGSWNGLLKPDILNILGLGLVVVATAWARVRHHRDIVVWFVVPAVVVVVLLAPWAQAWWWPTLLHPRLEAYIRPVGNYGVFSLFPPLGYMLAGAAVGEWLSRDGDAVLTRLNGLAAVAVAVGVVATLIVRPTPDKWCYAALVFLWRTGTMVLLLSIARASIDRWSTLGTGRVILFGQTSLFVYWVHVELVYGIFSYPLHNTLTLPWSLAGYAMVTLLMSRAAAVWARQSSKSPWIPAHMVAPA